MAAPGVASADLLVRSLDRVLDGEEFAFDLDGDGANDFLVIDSGAGSSTIAPVDPTAAGVLTSDAGSAPLVFSPGDLVDDSEGVMNEAGATLFDADGGAFGDVGSTGFVGLTLRNGNDPYFFGWAQITRGSTILGDIGFETTPGAPALIPVPEPGALGLLLTGAAAWWGRRRR